MATVTIRRPSLPAISSESTARATAGTDRITITAASTTSESPRPVVLGIAYGALLLAALGALVFQNSLKEPLALAMGASAFALFYVAAQAVERGLEPFTHWVLPTDKTKQDAADAKGDAATTEDAAVAMTKAGEAANKEAELTRKTHERAILFWALSSVVGIGASVWLGLYFFAAILENGSTAVPRWLDVIATGLVVGGGTKVLHDLIGKVQKPPATETTSDS